MIKRQIVIFVLCLSPWSARTAFPQITVTSESRTATMSALPLGSAVWTGGFWGERFGVFAGTSVTSMWDTWRSEKGKGWNNFLIAAGEKEGAHHGPPFHDGDMFKWLESLAAVYAVNHDAVLDSIMDEFIRVVAKAQRPNGYIQTQVTIAEDNALGGGDSTVVGTAVGKSTDGAFGSMLNFETYNMGHLITAGIIHKRATGKTTLFDCAVKAADFLYRFYKKAPLTLAKNAVCPSHYMAVTEMYRETRDPRYLELAEALIDIRSMVADGTDDNQDRIPFRSQYNAMGHAVRANYLYAGAADLYLETGEEQLKKNLDAIWNDITYRKMYVNGACGALYDGTSPDGTCYTPDSIQKIHQAYGRPYQLPQSTSHNETCANIGNMLFNWRMYLAGGDTRYMDIVENCLYNSILPGISLDGRRYFYVNPMRLTSKLPYTLRWPKERKELISCFCCPPNTLRTLCEAQDYAYTERGDTLYVNLYGENTLKTGDIELSMHTDYPWDGKIRIVIEKAGRSLVLKCRVPSWAASAMGQKSLVFEKKKWRKGDAVEFVLPMDTRLIEANPLVEEARGQVAVERGPIIYCLESDDMDIDDIVIPADAVFTPVEMFIGGARMMALETDALERTGASWTASALYRELNTSAQKRRIRLIPYYAWGNRGKSEMSVWLRYK